MTTDMLNHPGTGLAALFGSGKDLSEALAGAGLTDWIDQNVGSALGGLSADARAATSRQITATVTSLLNVNPVDVLVGGWCTYRKLTDAARGTLAAAGSTELLPIADHQITEAANPSVTVLVDNYRVATLPLTISVVCDVQGMLAKVSAGRLMAIESGRCYLTVALALADAEVTSKTARFDLPGVVPLGRGLRLLPVEQYPQVPAPARPH
jgi:hypothetical protein